MWVIYFSILIIIGLIPEKDYTKKRKGSIVNINNQDFAFLTIPIWKKTQLLRNFLLKREFLLWSCGEKVELQVDHIVPISRGGTDDMGNLQLLCYECHQKKHNYEFDEMGTNNQKAIGKYKKLRDAINQKQKLKIKYEAYNGEVTERVISPLNIILKDGKN